MGFVDGHASIVQNDEWCLGNGKLQPIVSRHMNWAMYNIKYTSP